MEIININMKRTPRLINAINKALQPYSLTVNSGSVVNCRQANFFLDKGCATFYNYEKVAEIIRDCLAQGYKGPDSLDTEWEGMPISEVVIDGRNFTF